MADPVTLCHNHHHFQHFKNMMAKLLYPVGAKYLQEEEPAHLHVCSVESSHMVASPYPLQQVLKIASFRFPSNAAHAWVPDTRPFLFR